MIGSGHILALRLEKKPLGLYSPNRWISSPEIKHSSFIFVVDKNTCYLIVKTQHVCFLSMLARLFSRMFYKMESSSEVDIRSAVTQQRPDIVAKWLYLQKVIKSYYYFSTQVEENTSQEFRPDCIRKAFCGAEQKRVDMLSSSTIITNLTYLPTWILPDWKSAE